MLQIEIYREKRGTKERGREKQKYRLRHSNRGIEKGAAT
jgi:hypothetical protein